MAMTVARRGVVSMSMSKALAWYFAISGVCQVPGASSGPSDTRVYAIVGMVVWFTLAVGLYRRYRAARIAAVGVCTLMAGIGIIVWFLSGFQVPLSLIGTIIFGFPLVGLLHPRARAECVRSFRIPGRSRNE